ncbi:MAG: TMEM14 family protein [Scytonema sp. PMC 1069.18]|nr:TMEM14 family protein [Scytonema sp. PMC 1069.18]MEC4885625.1 TMEM14 family protein [Scytonema sp. PMC 1070.18]
MMTLGVVAALAYGILAFLGGIIGYRKANSKASLISGSVSGILLIIATFLQLLGQAWGLLLASIITAVLVIFFTVRLVKTRKFMPAGLMAVLGVVALATMMVQLIET